jgi:hypothetical protein
MSNEMKKLGETGMTVNELSVGIENLAELVDLFRKAIDQTEQLQKTITQINEFRVNVKAK